MAREFFHSRLTLWLNDCLCTKCWLSSTRLISKWVLNMNVAQRSGTLDSSAKYVLMHCLDAENLVWIRAGQLWKKADSIKGEIKKVRFWGKIPKMNIFYQAQENDFHWGRKHSVHCLASGLHVIISNLKLKKNHTHTSLFTLVSLPPWSRSVLFQIIFLMHLQKFLYLACFCLLCETRSFL